MTSHLCTWSAFLIIEVLYALGMTAGFILSILPLLSVVLVVMHQKYMNDITDRKPVKLAESPTRIPNELDAFD